MHYPTSHCIVRLIQAGQETLRLLKHQSKKTCDSKHITIDEFLQSLLPNSFQWI